MATLSIEAEAQLDALRHDFADKKRPEAIDRLADAVQAALVEVDRGGPTHRRYPATYLEVAGLGMQWVSVHRYWFGYVSTPSGKVIANIFFDAADIPRRLRPRV